MCAITDCSECAHKNLIDIDILNYLPSVSEWVLSFANPYQYFKLSFVVAKLSRVEETCVLNKTFNTVIVIYDSVVSDIIMVKDRRYN